MSRPRSTSTASPGEVAAKDRIRPPALFGHELAGIVEEVGPGVASVAPGMPVVAANSAPCGACRYCLEDRASLCDDLLFWNGAYAEFARIPARIVERNLLALDPGLSFAAGALVEPLACVLRGVEASGVRAGQTVVVIGSGAIGLMLAALARLRGAFVVVVGRNPGRLARAVEMGASLALDASSVADLGERLRTIGPDGSGPDVVIEAAGLVETAQAAIHAVRKGGLVNLFAGCPADARVALEVPRLHYEELTVTSTFHHTPESFRAAHRLISEGQIRAEAFITAQALLDELPAVLRGMADGVDGLKTAILPWGK